MVTIENIQTNDIIQMKRIIFTNMYVYTHILTILKEAINLKDREEGLEKEKGRRKRFNYNYKKKRKDIKKTLFKK